MLVELLVEYLSFFKYVPVVSYDEERRFSTFEYIIWNDFGYTNYKTWNLYVLLNFGTM